MFPLKLQVVNLKKDNRRLMAELNSMAAEAKAANQERDDLMASHTVGRKENRAEQNKAMSIACKQQAQTFQCAFRKSLLLGFSPFFAAHGESQRTAGRKGVEA